MTGAMEASFRAARDRGRKLLVPYITGGLRGWQDALRAAVAAGAATAGSTSEAPELSAAQLEELRRLGYL